MARLTADKEKTAEIVKKFGGAAANSGTTEVQVALITDRINGLAPHFEKNPKDHLSRRGLLKLVGQRKRLLNYLRTTHTGRYQSLIQALNLRK